MKKFIAILVLIIVGVMVVLFCNQNEKVNEEYLRIHIRANSNLEIDQNVKYKIKDKVVEFLIPILCECQTKEQAQSSLAKNLNNIESVADLVLRENGFQYSSKAKINNEYFPTRSYSELTLDEGFYDALILELGSGQGDNWWCVVYPPMCFVSANPTGQEVVYKSKILHIINKILGREEQ